MISQGFGSRWSSARRSSPRYRSTVSATSRTRRLPDVGSPGVRRSAAPSSRPARMRRQIARAARSVTCCRAATARALDAMKSGDCSPARGLLTNACAWHPNGFSSWRRSQRCSREAAAACSKPIPATRSLPAEDSPAAVDPHPGAVARRLSVVERPKVAARAARQRCPAAHRCRRSDRALRSAKWNAWRLIPSAFRCTTTSAVRAVSREPRVRTA
jgi:hypothetical protein